MKYFGLILIVSLTFIKCNKVDGDSLNDGKIKIIYTIQVNNSEKIIEKIVQLAQEKGFKEIDSIQIGYFRPRPDSNQIFVYEKEIIKNNNREVKRRAIRLNVKDWLKNDEKLENLFTNIHIAENDLWKYKIGKNSIYILQNETINYEEAEEILNMINSENYLVQCDIDSTFPKRDINEIAHIEKRNNEYEIEFHYGHYVSSIVCVKLNNKLIINKFNGYKYP